jgi:hypothetical protein
LYIGTSGKKVWYVRYLLDEQEKTHKLGIINELYVAQARDMASDFMPRLKKGEITRKKQAPKITFGEFLAKEYEQWILLNHGSGKKTLDMLRRIMSLRILLGGLAK